MAAGDAARPYGLSNEFIAIVYQESSFCQRKIGKHGELGCSQLKPGTARIVDPDVDVDRLLTDDKYNLRIGAMVLDRCHHRFRNWARGIVCYHAGMQAALDTTNQKAENHPYVAKIRSRLAEFTTPRKR